jgi:biopolymer transport protein ExbD
MNDAENLSKLLGHLPPALFREFMAEEFSVTMPELDAKKPKKEQREQMEVTLSALGVIQVETFRRPTRNDIDVAKLTELPNLSDVKVFDTDALQAAEEYKTVIETWQKAIEAAGK